MAKYKGLEFLIQISVTSVWTDLAYFRTNELSIDGEQVDVTTKGDMPWRQTLANAGLRSLSLSGDGVMTDAATILTLEAAARSGDQLTLRVISEKGDYYECAWDVTNFTRGGELNGAETFSATFESAGTPTYTAPS